MDMVKLKAELTRDEGEEFKPYVDTVGQTTIGVGRNLTDVGISRDEAQYLLENDIARSVADLDAALPWWKDLTENRQRVLVNMCFNLGITRLLGFKNTLRYIKDKSYAKAAIGMRASLWYNQVGARAERLATLMEKG